MSQAHYLFERVEDLRRAAVFIARVKGQIDDLLGRITQVRRAVLLQAFATCVSRGRLPLLRETQPPRSGRHRLPIPLTRHDDQARQNAQHQQKRQIPP